MGVGSLEHRHRHHAKCRRRIHDHDVIIIDDVFNRLCDHIDDVEALILREIACNLVFEIVQLQIGRDQIQAVEVRLPDDLPNAEQLRVMEMPVKSIVLAKIHVGPIAKHHGRASLAVAVNEKHAIRSEEHTYELQSLMSTSYAV